MLAFLASIWAATARMCSSLKVQTTIVGLLVTSGARWGVHVSPEVQAAILILFGALVHAQGQADHGKEAAKIAADAQLAVAFPMTGRAADVPPPTPPTGALAGAVLVAILVGLATSVVVVACSATPKSVAGDVVASAVDCLTPTASKVTHELGPVVDAQLAQLVDHGDVDWNRARDVWKGIDPKGIAACVLVGAVSRALSPQPADPSAPRASPLEIDATKLRASFEAYRNAELAGQHYRLEGGVL